MHFVFLLLFAASLGEVSWASTKQSSAHEIVIERDIAIAAYETEVNLYKFTKREENSSLVICSFSVREGSREAKTLKAKTVLKLKQDPAKIGDTGLSFSSDNPQIEAVTCWRELGDERAAVVSNDEEYDEFEAHEENAALSINELNAEMDGVFSFN